MNLKPRVMAVTHGLVFDTNCNDMLVELIEFVPAHMVWVDPHGFPQIAECGCWGVMSLGSMFPANGRDPATRYALFAPCNLRPIDGGESPEESTEAMRKLHELPQEVTT